MAATTERFLIHESKVGSLPVMRDRRTDEITAVFTRISMDRVLVPTTNLGDRDDHDRS
jgi:hypothetical protein